MLEYEAFCNLVGLQPYDDGAELGSSLEAYEVYVDAYKCQVRTGKIQQG